MEITVSKINDRTPEFEQTPIFKELVAEMVSAMVSGNIEETKTAICNKSIQLVKGGK